MNSSSSLQISSSSYLSRDATERAAGRQRGDAGTRFELPEAPHKEEEERKTEDEGTTHAGLAGEPVVSTSKAVAKRAGETDTAAASKADRKEQTQRGKKGAENKAASSTEKTSPNKLLKQQEVADESSKAIDPKLLNEADKRSGIPSASLPGKKMFHARDTHMRSDAGPMALASDRVQRASSRSPLTSDILALKEARAKAPPLESSKGNDSGSFGQQDFTSRSQSLVSQAIQQSHSTHTAQDLNPLLMSALHRMQESQQRTMRMSLRMSDGSTLGIRLELSGGRIKTHFNTEDEALRKSIQNGWNSLINEAAENGIQLDPPHFEDADSTTLEERQFRYA